MPLVKMFSRNLKAARIAKDLSQEALATRAGCGTSYVSMLERGLRSPPLETIEQLARALRVAPLKLLS